MGCLSRKSLQLYLLALALPPLLKNLVRITGVEPARR
ncbi:hypothetical protein CLOLEP_01404 [[Clostridium] leptum DSM 753]|uniref:Uncharacterized protein n=1 Tax=[Clostridium] leptum DSM 753 TaxID=428125 RepID=A7VS66_9FIRM|nr:hypothetical protein CLOLEP_01404 [[Clostridium] leptum DSM 753]